jgi:DNA polymerase-3 subunit delta'
MAQRNLLLYGLSILREATIHLSGARELNRSAGPELEFVRNFSKVMTVRRIESIAVNFNDSVYQLERNGSAKMIFMDLSLRINNIIRQ